MSDRDGAGFLVVIANDRQHREDSENMVLQGNIAMLVSTRSPRVHRNPHAQHTRYKRTWLPGFIRRKIELHLRSKIQAGVQLRDQGDLKASKELLSRVVKKCKKWLGGENTESLNALVQLGRTCCQMEDYDQSLAVHKQVLQYMDYAHSQVEDFAVILADGLALAGRSEDARSVLKYTVEAFGVIAAARSALKTSKGPAACELAAMHNTHRQSEWDKAATVEWLKALTDTSAGSAMVLADTLLLEHRTDEAHLILKHSVAEFTESSCAKAAIAQSTGPAICALASLLTPIQSSGDKTEATMWLKEYIKIEPVSPEMLCDPDKWGNVHRFHVIFGVDAELQPAVTIQFRLGNHDPLYKMLRSIGIDIAAKEDYHHCHLSCGHTESWSNQLFVGGMPCGKLSVGIDTYEDRNWEISLSLPGPVCQAMEDALRKAGVSVEP